MYDENYLSEIPTKNPFAQLPDYSNRELWKCNINLNALVKKNIATK